VKGFATSDDDGAAQPFGHGKLSLERIMVDKKMIKEFHNMIAELFFVDIYFGCCNVTHNNLRLLTFYL
jgi:hypothetical protein